MNNLYNKIYEAVNTGIQKALIINNDQSDDTSVDFHHKKISVDIDMLDHYVYELLYTDESPKYCCQKIAKYVKENQKRYVVKNFDELSEIYWKIRTAYEYASGHLKWLDMRNVVTLILNDGSEMAYMENIKNARFIKFKNNITGHDIILHKSLKTSDDLISWMEYSEYENFDESETVKQEDIYDDYDGYKHTYIDGNTQNEDLRPFMYCKKQSMDGYAGYLPAFGELTFLRRYTDLINYLLRHINGKEFNSDIISALWTSTEAFENSVWCYGYGGPDTVDKYACHNFVIPFFKQTNIQLKNE